MADYTYPQSGSGSGNAAAGPTGAAVPGSADYIGFNSGGNLVGVSASNPLPVTIDGDIVIANVNIADFGGTPVTIGQQLSAASMPVVLASNQSAIPVSQSGTWNVGLNAGSNVIGSISNTSFIVTQASGANLHVNVDNFPATQPVSGTVAVTQSTSPWIVAGGGTAGVSGTAVLTVQGIAGGTALPVSGTVSATQSGTWTVQPGNTANTTAWLVTGTGGTFPATQSGAWNITNITGTISLPTGASTSANQTTLGSQTTKLNDGTNTAAVKAASTAAVAADPALVVAISPNNTIKTSSPVNANGSFSGSISVTTTEASTAAPANAVGVVFEAESSNAVNIRWGVSNSSGAILSTSSGVLMEPGRSIDFLPIGTGTFLHYIATAAGSNVIDIQWVLSA